MFNDLTRPLGVGAFLLVSAAGAGIVLYRTHLRRDALRSMSASSQWPITARELVAPDEHEVWQWLCEVFADYHVMIKIPLVRYTAPTPPRRKQGLAGSHLRSRLEQQRLTRACPLGGVIIS